MARPYRRLRRSELDVLGLLRSKLRARSYQVIPGSMAGLYLSLAIAATKEVRRFIRLVNYETGRPITTTATARRKRKKR